MICKIEKDKEIVETIYNVAIWKHYNHRFIFYLRNGYIWKYPEEDIDFIYEYDEADYEK